MTEESLLFIGPHPDDVFIACAGHIIKNVESRKVFVLCVATEDLKPYTHVRISEEETAWSVVSPRDIELIKYPGRDTRLHESYCDIVNFIEKTVNSIPDLKYVFTPDPNDTHQDHRTVSEATLSACRYFRNILFYETPSTISFAPTMFVEMDEETMAKKKEISKNYASQILGTDQYAVDLQTLIESKAISNGLKTRSCKYAEGYTPFRMFV